MKDNRFGIGIVGCGNISEHYALTMTSFPQLELIGFTDIDQPRAKTMAERFGAKVFDSLETMLQSSEVDIILNLTIFQAHYEVTKASLLAGKHVFSEKPLALSNDQSFELVELAKRQAVKLACAPSVFLGDAQETAWRFLETGKLGDIRLVFAEVNQGRIEVWHPAPEPFYQVGPIIDVGIYAITLTTALFGPITRVRAFGETLMPKRVTKEGRAFELTIPDFYEIIFELANGIVFRLNTNYYVDTGEKDIGYAVHGDKGSLYMTSWHNYDASVSYRNYGDKTNYQPIPLIREPFTGPKKVEWCRGLNSFANSIRYNSQQVIQGEHAAHVMEAILAAHESALSGEPVKVNSTFVQPGLDLVEKLNEK